MKMTFRYLLLSFLLFGVLIGLPNKVSSQEVKNEGDEILSIVNTIYRSDDRLINGKYYTPKHFFAEGHPYFLLNDWKNSTLFIKGIQYNEIPLKYNIEDDVLIIKVVIEDRISKDILLNNSFVDSLIIDSHIFHNTDNETQKNIGFAELIYRGKNQAYFKHSIEFLDELTDRLKFGKYLKPKKVLYLSNGESFIAIKKKKDLLTYFPEHDKEVKMYLRKNNILLKKASSKQIENLIQFCEQL